MGTFLLVLLFFVGLFLMFVVLLQRGRGGGLAGAFGGLGGQSAFGTKAGDVFTIITIVTAAIWVVLSCLAGWRLREESKAFYANRPGVETEIKSEGKPPADSKSSEPGNDKDAAPGAGDKDKAQDKDAAADKKQPPAEDAAKPSSAPAAKPAAEKPAPKAETPQADEPKSDAGGAPKKNDG